MTKPAHSTDRHTLISLVTVAILAASLAATWIPTQYTPGQALTWAITYTTVSLGLAKTLRLPPARTFIASALMTAAVLHLALTALRHSIDGALTGLARLHAAGTNMLATTPQKAA